MHGHISYSYAFTKPLIRLLVFTPYVLSGDTLSLRNFVVILSFVDLVCLVIILYGTVSLLYGTDCLVAVARIQVKSVVFSNICMH